MTQPKPAGRAGEFVYTDEVFPGRHTYVTPIPLHADLRDADGSPLTPDIDILLANATPSAEAFIAEWVENAYSEEEGLLGPYHLTSALATRHVRLGPHFASAPRPRQNALQFAAFITALLTAVEQFTIADFGAPAYPTQLLGAAQRALIAIQPEWTRPPLLSQAEIIGDVYYLAQDFADVTAAQLESHTLDADQADSLMCRLETLRTKTGVWNSIPIDQAAAAVAMPNLERLITQTAEAAYHQRRAAQAVQARETEARAERPQQVTTIMRIPVEGGNSMTADDKTRLDEAIIRGGTRSITLDNVGPLLRAYTPLIKALDCGGEDITHLDIPHELHRHLGAVRRELYPETSIRAVPIVLLLKLVTLRLSEEDNVGWYLFGDRVFIDHSTRPLGSKKVQAARGSVMVLKTRLHVWQNDTWIHPFEAISRGLEQAARRLLHPSVLPADGIYALYRKLRFAYDEHAGLCPVPTLFRAYTERIAEHCRAVNAAVASGHTAAPLPPLTELSGESLRLLEQAIENGKRRIAEKRGDHLATGYETETGRAQSRPTGMDARGISVSYLREHRRDQGKRSNGAALPLNRADGRGGKAPRTTPPKQELRERRPAAAHARRHTAPDVCVKCGGIGHLTDTCRAAQWCVIPDSWVGRTRTHAVRLRHQQGVTPRYEHLDRSN